MTLQAGLGVSGKLSWQQTPDVWESTGHYQTPITQFLEEQNYLYRFANFL